MTQVAMAYGQSFASVWRAPYHETLMAFAGLVQRRRIEELTEHARDLRSAFRVNAAFAAPKELQKEHGQLMRALRKSKDQPRDVSAAELVAKFADLQPVTPHGD